MYILHVLCPSHPCYNGGADVHFGGVEEQFRSFENFLLGSPGPGSPTLYVILQEDPGVLVPNHKLPRPGRIIRGTLLGDKLQTDFR